MSESEQGGAGRREVAYRLFAAEYEDADFSYSESDEERAPNYVVTPSGARVNRLFVVGVLTEVTQVSDDVLRARVVDPTGPFVIYAGQYQPDALAFIERAEPPTFVAVTGKARTFQPDDSDTVYTSIRPESINEVDAGTRDRWVVGTAEQTLGRVETMARALARDERGDDLRDALVAEGVDDGLAAGVALAIEHYHTTPTYLAGLRDLALDAARVVANERDEVESLSVAPDAEGTATVDDLVDLGDLSVETTTRAGADSTTTSPTSEPAATGTVESSEPVDETTSGESDPTTEPEPDTPAEPESTTGEPETGSTDVSGDVAAADTSTSEGSTADDATDDGDGVEDEAKTEEEGEDDIGDFEPGEFEIDEEEREQIEDEYGTEFETGTEVDDPGEADIETPDPDEPEPEADAAAEAESGSEPESETAAEPEPEPESASDSGDESAEEPVEESEPAAESGESEAESEADQPESAAGSEDEPAEDLDLLDVVMDSMKELDDGDGADRQALIDSVVDETGATAEEVEDAIQDALMDGRCYEPGENALKPI